MSENRADLRECIERVKEKVEIEAVVARRVQLQRRSGRLWGLCPFHPEKTPSFTVVPERGFYKCFGCGKGGDVFSFVAETEGLSFFEALRQLADEAGVELPSRWHGEGAASSPLREPARQALALARKLYHEALARPDAEPARAYLRRRQVSEESVRGFQLGWAPNEPGWLVQRLAAAQLPPAALVEAGLAYEPDGGGPLRDRFFERVMFPVLDAAGRPVGFGGRYLPGSKAEEKGLGKYVNSPEGPLFQKRRLLFALDRLPAGLRNQGEAPILLCEGFLDVVLLHQAGFATAVAALGTAFTEENARRLRRFDRPVVLVLDPDPAGRRAAARAAQLLLAEGVDTRVAELPEAVDPADMVSQGRVEDLRQRLAAASDVLRWRLRTWSERADLRQPAVKDRAARELADWVARARSPVIAAEWINLACDALALPQDTFRRLLAPAAPGPAEPAARGANSPSAAQLLAENEKEMVAALLLDPSLYSRYRAELEQGSFHDPNARALLDWCRRRRGEGLAFDLAHALEAFAADPLLPWLDGIRLLQGGDPDRLLQSALRAHRVNLDLVFRAQRGGPVTDQDLARWVTPGLRSASQSRR